MRHLAFFLLVALIASVGTGCSNPMVRRVSSNVDFSLASRPVIYWDEWVRKGQPQVFVSADRAPESPPTAVFMPLRMTQPVENANAIGYNLSRIVWQTWLQANALPALEFAETTAPYRADLALAYGRQRNADLVVGGAVNYFSDGGTVGSSAVSIAIEIHDVKSGALLWSFGQAATMQAGKVGDFLLFATKSRVPADPATACLTAAADDLARIIRAWAYDIDPDSESIFTPRAF